MSKLAECDLERAQAAFRESEEQKGTQASTQCPECQEAMLATARWCDTVGCGNHKVRLRK